MERSYQFIFALMVLMFASIVVLELENVTDLGVYLTVFAFEYIVLDEMFKVRKIAFDFLKLALFVIFVYIVAIRIINILV